MSEPGASEIQQPRIPDFKLPPKGTRVSVRRSSGELENDWQVVGENPGNQRITVIKGNTDLSLTKELKREDFISQNPIPGILDAKSFKDLEKAIDRVAFVPGATREYSSPDLKFLIEQVRKGTISVNELTRAGGLRSKVWILMHPGES